MIEHDPIATAQQQLQAAVMGVLKGGDPNTLRVPYCAYLRALGKGKFAREVDQLPALPYVKPVRK